MCCHNHCDTAIISIIIYNLSLYTLPSYHGVLMMPSSAIIQCYHGGISCGNLLWEGLCGAPVKPDCEQSSNLLTYEKKVWRTLKNSPTISMFFLLRNPQTSHSFVEGVSSPRSLAASRSREAAGSWVARSRKVTFHHLFFSKNHQFFHKVVLFILCFYIL